MQKQIFIRHDSGEINDIVSKIINCMQLVVMPDDVVKCLFCLEKDSYSIVEEIKINTSYKTLLINEKRKLFSRNKVLEVETSYIFKNLINCLKIIEKNDLNAVIIFDKIKLILNDNDGDFIVINSRNKHFSKLKWLSNKTNKS